MTPFRCPPVSAPSLRFERTRDLALVKSIITHPSSYRHAGDDYSPPPEQFQPTEHEAIWYVLAYDGDELLGLFSFAPQNAVCWEVHTNLLPQAWGARAAAAARGVAQWIWENTMCERIVTTVPESNRLALRFAREARMIEYGRNPASIKKGGRLRSQILLGLSREGE